MENHEHPLTDLAYDWITVIQNKSEALAVYDQYIEDAEDAGSQECVELFKRLHEADSKHVEEAVKHLRMVLESGK